MRVRNRSRRGTPPFVARSLFAVGLVALAACTGGTGNAPGPGSSSTSSGTPSPPDTPPPGTTPPACTLPTNVDLEVTSAGLSLYPSYAVHACTLAYVNRAGALMLRDLAAGTEKEIEPASRRPEKPTVANKVVAWTASVDGVSRVRMLVEGEPTARTTEGGVATDEPRAFDGVVVFTVSKTAGTRGDMDVLAYDTATKTTSRVLDGPGQQRFASVNEKFFAVTDFSEDPDGVLDENETDLADIVLVERATGAVIRRKSPGKQAFPFFVSNDVLGYLSWGLVRPEPKLVAFDLHTGPLAEDVSRDKKIAFVEQHGTGEIVAPSGKDGILEWVTRKEGVSTLYRSPADGATPPVATTGLEGLTLFAPSMTSGFTVLAAAKAGAFDPRLRVVPR